MTIPKKFFEKVIFAILTGVATISMKFLDDLNSNTKSIMIELSRIRTQLEFHDVQIRTLTNHQEAIYRVESELGTHEKRLMVLEQRLYGGSSNERHKRD